MMENDILGVERVKRLVSWKLSHRSKLCETIANHQLPLDEEFHLSLMERAHEKAKNVLIQHAKDVSGSD
jgi:hypothetical protein